VSIRFTTSYVTDCEGLNYYKDTEDGEEYMYTDSEPANQHKVFPCFDQPDLKASYTLLAIVPKGWHVFANSPQTGECIEINTPGFEEQLKNFGVSQSDFTK
jgi:aminopeptidase N